MRILQIRLKNLNSLAGEWQVNLDDPAYAAEGLFAITGPTGAGKSTLLDAICLALYGRTPRLGRISKSQNEIMSRQRGECFAEVTFETATGRYRCHWSQHRARRKADGELQTPRHEIADADTAALIDSSLKGVGEQVEAITGMDFDHFTRAMLLAQGSFAAFLQASADERSPLLEQITGTALYSRISIRVHEQHSSEQKRLALLKASLDGLMPLSREAEQALLEQQQVLQQQEQALLQQVTQARQAVQWREGLLRLEYARDQFDRQQAALLDRQHAFQSQQARLDTANRAQALGAEHAHLLAERQTHRDDQQTHTRLLEHLPAQQQARQQAQQHLQQAEQQAHDLRQALQQAQPLWRQVRELDLRQQEKALAQDALQQRLAQQQAQLEQRCREQQADRQCQEHDQARLDELAHQQQQAQADAALVEQFAALGERLATLEQQRQDLAQAQASLQQTLQQQTLAHQARQHAEHHLQQQQAVQVQQQQALEQQQANWQQLLEGRPLADWRRQYTRHLQYQHLLVQAIQAQGEQQDAQRALDHAGQRQQQAQQKQQPLQQRAAQLQQHVLGLEREQQLLETQAHLLQQIQDLQQARQQLQDDQPCPLCGALEHPFAQGNLPQPDQTRLQLDDLRARLNQARQQQTQCQLQLHALAQEQQQALHEQEQQQQRLAHARQRLLQALQALPDDWALHPGQAELGNTLAQRQQHLQQQVSHEQVLLEQAEALEQQLGLLATRLEHARHAGHQAEQQALSARARCEHSEQQHQHCLQQQQRLQQQVHHTSAALEQALAPFGIPLGPADNGQQALEQLQQRRDQWLQRQQQQQQLERHLHALSLRLQHRHQQIQQERQQHTTLQAQRDGLQQERQQLAEQRQLLFGERSVEAEEQQLAEQGQHAEQHLHQARSHAQQQADDLLRLQTRLESLALALAQQAPRLHAAEQAFSVQLQQAGFSDESGYRLACLPEKQRLELAEQARQLQQAQLELDAQRQDNARQLQQQQGLQLSEAPLETLQQQHEHVLQQQKQLHQQSGAIQQQLENNQRLQQQRQAQLQALAAQQRECQRWEMLHSLIGSADGKKYRNFAQGLTFELMVSHANQQLQRMSDRYLLVRDATQPLELNVIDNYQAGERRSTKNLSGGESFIVSLALALGLSRMVSQKVRVDSLFLDEGFGTLDEEALDTALETLGALQQDGKLIGIISHVAALKERIATQILVSPLRGGRSRLSGPGCHQLD